MGTFATHFVWAPALLLCTEKCRSNSLCPWAWENRSRWFCRHWIYANAPWSSSEYKGTVAKHWFYFALVSSKSAVLRVVETKTLPTALCIAVTDPCKGEQQPEQLVLPLASTSLDVKLYFKASRDGTLPSTYATDCVQYDMDHTVEQQRGGHKWLIKWHYLKLKLKCDLPLYREIKDLLSVQWQNGIALACDRIDCCYGVLVNDGLWLEPYDGCYCFNSL